MPYLDFNTQPGLQIFDGISGPVFHSEKATFGHFTLAVGCELPSHSHDNEQWTHIIEGELEFNIEGEIQRLTPGMTAYIPANAEHSARVITPCKVIDCFIPPREDFKQLGHEQNVE
jgi:quercetin dioxygenase-like cupin family protein